MIKEIPQILYNRKKPGVLARAPKNYNLLTPASNRSKNYPNSLKFQVTTHRYTTVWTIPRLHYTRTTHCTRDQRMHQLSGGGSCSTALSSSWAAREQRMSVHLSSLAARAQTPPRHPSCCCYCCRFCSADPHAQGPRSTHPHAQG